MSDKAKRLLTSFEPMDIDVKAIKEQREQNGGKVILRGIMQRADAANQNGRIYTKSILEREVTNYQKFIRERRALGECDHPSDSVVNLKNVSHIVTEMHWEDDTVMGTIELLDTPMGKVAQTLVEAGVKLGISSRGVGSTQKQGSYDLVQDDYMLLCFDLVNDPSTASAFMLREHFSRTEPQLTRSDRIDRVLTDLLRACGNR